MIKEARIYYSNPKIVIMCNPTNGNCPVIVLRHQGSPSKPDWDLINRALSLCKMELTDGPSFRPDGLWYHPVKEVIEDERREELCNTV